jgi:hypothetical protein
VTCHPLIGVLGRPLPDVTLAFGPGGEMRVEAGDHAGTFPAPLPTALSLLSQLDDRKLPGAVGPSTSPAGHPDRRAREQAGRF